MSEHAGPRTLTYAFARDKGLVVMSDADDTVELGVRSGADPRSIIEARRALGRPLRFRHLDAQTFERELSEHYARSAVDGGETEAAMNGGDLHSLIDDIPQTADLLDGDDDAPGVRL
ncbi:MAG: type II secretion system protein GspE, partial [Henriciella sp.]